MSVRLDSYPEIPLPLWYIREAPANLSSIFHMRETRGRRGHKTVNQVYPPNLLII